MRLHEIRGVHNDLRTGRDVVAAYDSEEIDLNIALQKLIGLGWRAETAIAMAALFVRAIESRIEYHIRRDAETAALDSVVDIGLADDVNDLTSHDPMDEDVEMRFAYNISTETRHTSVSIGLDDFSGDKFSVSFEDEWMEFDPLMLPTVLDEIAETILLYLEEEE